MSFLPWLADRPGKDNVDNIFEKIKKPAERDVYRCLFEQMGSAFFIADAETGNIVECNAEAEKLIGRARNRIVGMHQSNLYPEGEEEKYKQIFTAHEREGRIDNYEADVRHSDGRRIPVMINARAFELQGRKLIMGIFVDLTERRCLEDGLRRQIEFILGATKTGLDIIDSDYNVRYVDGAWQEVYGAHSGKKCYEYFMGRKQPCPGCGVTRALTTKQPVVTEEILVRENNRPIQVATIPFQNSKGEWLVAEVNVDITERKRAEEELKKYHERLEEMVEARTQELKKANEQLRRDIIERKRASEALRESEEKYRALIDDASDGIILADTRGNILEANKMAVRLFGYTKEDFTKMHFSRLHPQSESQRVSAAFRFFKENGNGLLMDTLIVRKDGAVLPVDIIGSAIMYESNKVMMGVFRDISERKKIDRMKDNLIRDVSHELKAPIAMMEMALGMQQRAIEAGDHDEIRNAWKMGCRNLKTLSKDVNNILKMFSLSARRVTPQREQISLKRMVAEIIKDLRDLASQKELRIRLDIPPGLDKIHADRRMIRTLIYNIVENAIKFTSHGAVSVTVRATKKEIFLEVKDAGCGIELKDKSMLFTRFFKQDPSIQGTGLGLPICKEIAAIYGGVIEVDSEGAGKGATVTVKLPRASLGK